MTPTPGLLTWRVWANPARLSNMCSMIAVEPTIPARRPDAYRVRLELVSATDGRTHRVVERAYGDALAARAGHCVAICGHDVVLCALTTPPGPPCGRCAVLP
jgi:hypothetical protein